MAAKKCVDCGAALMGWNGLFSQSKCSDCLRVTYYRSKAYFEQHTITEQDIQNWKIGNSKIYLFGYALFLYACIIIGCLIGFRLGGPTRGLLYAFVATLLGIVIFRWWMSNTSVHPLNSHLWFNFALPYTYILFFIWAFAWVGWMPGPMGSIFFRGRSILSFHIRITPQFTVPAFWIVLLVGVIAVILGAMVGVWFASKQFPKNKAHLITLYQRWQQIKALKENPV